MPAMTHGERVRAVLQGQEVDRPPVSMWRHFFAEEATAEGLASAMLAFQRRFDWDFVKVNPRAGYHIEVWGGRLAHGPGQPPQTVIAPVRAPEDWARITPAPLSAPPLAEHLTALERILEGLAGEDVPVLMTVFSPLSIASRLTPGEEVFLRHLREHPEKVTPALEAIAETFARFAQACVERGASGLFFATVEWATRDRLTPEEHRRWARPWDLRVLSAVADAPFHLLHVCRDRNLLAHLRDYPVHAFNWDARGEGNPSLAEGKALVGNRAVVGGISHRSGLVRATPAQIRGEVLGLRAAMGRRGWMVGPGCTFPPETPEENLDALRQAVDAPLSL